MSDLPENGHMFAVLGVEEGQSPAGFYCVQCKHFWPGPLDTLSARTGNECPSFTDSLLAPEVRAEWQPDA